MPLRGRPGGRPRRDSLNQCDAMPVHPRTPPRLDRFAETHRQVGAICNAAVWVEYQLEIAISELDGTFELDPDNQGRFWSELTKRMRQLLESGLIDDLHSTASLLQLVTDVREAMSTLGPQRAE